MPRVSIPGWLALIGAAAFALPLLAGGGTDSWSDETSTVTLASLINLWTIAWLNLAIYKRRHGGGWPAFPSLRRRIASPRAIWLVMAVGFFYLGLDDVLQIHENIDKWIHALLHAQPDNLTDRIDDLLVLLYGLIGLAVMWRSRRDLLAYRAELWPLVPGFLLMVAMVACDTLTNRADILSLMVPADRLRAVVNQIEVAEEMTKILGSLVIATAFHRVLRTLTRATTHLSPTTAAATRP